MTQVAVLLESRTMDSFAAVPPALASALSQRGFAAFTPVQQAVLDPALAGRDLIVSARTGSGKTVAFGIAIAPQIVASAGSGLPAGLVIAPTRELALQVRAELEWLYAETGVRIASAVGGMSMRTERRALENGAEIVVGTPGRLRDHVTRGSLDISGLTAIVLDEADEMLDLGFRDDLEFLLSAAPEDRRTLMFSATVPRPIAELARRFQRRAERVAVEGGGRQHEDIEYRLLTVAPAERENAVINTLLYFDADNALVFCATREAVRHLASRLANRGFSVVALSGELSQAERNNALQAMRDGRARVCVATDVAARGIDLPGLDLVIHADLPGSPETLLHRSGRTGRAGRKGVCAIIAPHHRRRSAERLLKQARLEAATGPAPGAAEIAAREAERVLSAPVLSAPVTEEERRTVAALTARFDAEALAAAYLRLSVAGRPAPEELSDADAPAFDAALGERPQSRFAGGVWFRVSLGRRDKAEPRWLLPLICKAGRVTRQSVGSIRILEHETRFEIAADAAAGFAAATSRREAAEKGVRFAPLEGDAAQPVAREARRGRPKEARGTAERRPYAKKAPRKRRDT